ncbi:MAG: hypothetical protein M0Z38_06910 [Deltaproteobacteria bacterium]|nr:hypothetical protein [Deltaproteobacteria bacterium]
MEKNVVISEVGNAYKIQLLTGENGNLQDHGKPVVVLDTAKDEAIGAAVRSLFRARIRTKKEKKGEEAAG